MNRPWHRQLAILLIAAQLTICVGNEALHLLPGLGHYVRMPNGVCLWLGNNDIEANENSQPEPPTPTKTTWKLSHQQKGDILSEDECGVCSLYSLSSELGVATYWLPSDRICGWSSLYQPIVVSTNDVYLHGARAPPA